MPLKEVRSQDSLLCSAYLAHPHTLLCLHTTRKEKGWTFVVVSGHESLPLPNRQPRACQGRTRADLKPRACMDLSGYWPTRQVR